MAVLQQLVDKKRNSTIKSNKNEQLEPNSKEIQNINQQNIFGFEFCNCS